MTIFSLLIWQVLGILIGLAMAATWKERGLTWGWALASGGVGGVVGGMLCRIVLPAGTLYEVIAIGAAAVGAVVAMFLARASIINQRSGTA